MKVLNMTCHCGAKKAFRGPDVRDIINQIDRSGWRDRSWLVDEGARSLPKGQTYGGCPEHAEDMSDPRSPAQDEEDE